MIRFFLSDPQRAQLQLLKDRGAVSQATSVGRGDRGHRHCAGVNGVMLGVALAPKGLVGVYKRPAWNGEPKATLYWITTAGIAALDEPPIGEQLRGFEGKITVDEFAHYDAASDAAEQLG